MLVIPCVNNYIQIRLSELYASEIEADLEMVSCLRLELESS